jgi:hypothetical protein
MLGIDYFYYIYLGALDMLSPFFLIFTKNTGEYSFESKLTYIGA